MLRLSPGAAEQIDDFLVRALPRRHRRQSPAGIALDLESRAHDIAAPADLIPVRQSQHRLDVFDELLDRAIQVENQRL